MTPGKCDRGDASVAQTTDYFTGIITERRAWPARLSEEGDDTILDALIAAEDRGDVLSEGKLVAFCVLVQFARQGTTTNLFGSGLYALFQHPDVHWDLPVWRLGYPAG